MTDEKIIELYWQRSETAIEETDRAYGRYFRSVANGILLDNEDAEETVNDAYLKAWNTIPPEYPNYLKAFLARITRQLSINRLEQNTAKKRGAGQYTLILDELAECIPDPNSMERVVDSRILADKLNVFLLELPKDVRKIFLRRYWELSSVKEIASVYGISESKVKMTLFRTRSKLRSFLEKEGIAL